MKRALICGISGQDGAYLARLLDEKGYQVVGTSRDAERDRFTNLEALGIRSSVRCRSMSLNDFRSVLTVLSEETPDEVYNLAGQSSVGLSFEQPVETMESIATATLNLLETIRFLGGSIRFYNAGSGECFGDTDGAMADETAPFRPRSPYAVAKAAAHWAVVNYREAYGLHACNGILFNHESPLRPPRFVTRKIINGAIVIKQGRAGELRLGNLDVYRDWGYAPEYVDAMWRMMQLETPQDFVIATGQAHSLKDFVARAFQSLDLDWEEYVVSDSSLKRPSEIRSNCGNPHKAKEVLDWKATTKLPGLVDEMIRHEMQEA